MVTGTTKLSTTVLSILLGVVMFLVFESISPQWSRPFTVTTIVFGWLLIEFRDVWQKPRFWFAFAVSVTIHAAGMMSLRTFFYQFRALGMFVVAVAEILVLGIALVILIPEHKVAE
jgi:hypothetical protein